MTLQQYAETVYFPNIKTRKSPSKVKGYVNLYNAQIQSRIGGLWLSTCTTADIQRLLYRIYDVYHWSIVPSKRSGCDAVGGKDSVTFLEHSVLCRIY
jgi:hypothetical protein